MRVVLGTIVCLVLAAFVAVQHAELARERSERQVQISTLEGKVRDHARTIEAQGAAILTNDARITAYGDLAQRQGSRIRKFERVYPTDGR